MTLRHEEFDQRIADAESLDALEADLFDHASECLRCRRRLDLARRIRGAAPTLNEPADDEDNISHAVLARTHRNGSRLPKLLAGAAALVVLAGAASILVRSTDGEPDVLADVADAYAEATEIRFVYATEASIDLSTEIRDNSTVTDEVTALSAQIPTCEEPPQASDDSDQVGDGAGLDLGPIAEAIASDDPCLALQLIDETARPAQDAFNALSRSINERQAAIDRLLADEDNSDLVAASAQAFLEDQRGEIEAAQRVLDDLERSYAELAATVEPLSSTEGDAFAAATVEAELVALQADTTAALDAVATVDPLVVWDQVATGTWTPDGIEIDGITERGNTVVPYTDVDDDPLGLAEVVLDGPGVLLELLQSAPSSTDDTIRWTVPEAILESDLEWTATAQLSDGQLRELRIESSTATIVFTPQQLR